MNDPASYRGLSPAPSRVLLPLSGAPAIAWAVGLALASLLLAAPAWAAVPQPEAYCFAVADSGDNLIFINKDGDGFVDQGPTGTTAMEAIAFNAGVSACDTVVSTRADQAGCLYATVGDDFGFIDYDDSWDGDTNDSEFIQVSSDVGSCTLPASQGGGTVTINDVDGLQFDLTRVDGPSAPSSGTFVLWASVRDGDGAAPNDVIFQIDPSTGLVDTTPTTSLTGQPQTGFEGGATCVRINGPGIQVDIDDVALDPTDGTLYVVNNTAGSIDLLATVDPVTGAGSIIGNFFNPLLQVQDMEGLSFGVDGQLYGTTGTNDTMYLVDKTAALSIPVVAFPSLGDYESIDCLTDNLITGTVFFDSAADGTFDPPDGDAGFGGARVLVYIDNNNDGVVDGGDSLLCDNPGGGYNLTCPITDTEGFYRFTVGQGNFVAEVDTSTLPDGHFLSTDNIEEADFATSDWGQEDPNNDFGFSIFPGGVGLDVTKTSDAGGPLVQGQTFTYTIEVTNNTPETHRELRVTDTLPPGVTYVAQTTAAEGKVSDFFEALDRFDGSAQLSFDWRCVGDMEQSGAAQDSVYVEISPNNGASWITLDTKIGEIDICLEPADNDSGSELYDLSPLLDIDPSDSLIRFRYTISATDEAFFVDNVEVSFTPTATYRDEFSAVAYNNTNGSLDWSGVGDEWDEMSTDDVGELPSAGSITITGGELRLEGTGGNPERSIQRPIDLTGVGVSYANDDGKDPWTAPWVETTDTGGAGPAAGNVRVVSGELRLTTNGSTIRREADLTGFSSAILSYQYRLGSTVDSGDTVYVEAATSSGGPWVILDTINLSGPRLARRTVDLEDGPSNLIAATTNIRFRVFSNYSAGEFFYADDVEILAGSSYREEAQSASLNNSDGILPWTGDWDEVDPDDPSFPTDDASAGDVRIGFGFGGRSAIVIGDNDTTLERPADLSLAGRAILTFHYRRDGLDNSAEFVAIDASRDGGASWTELARLSGATNDGAYVPAALDVSAFTTADFRVRFRSSPDSEEGDRVLFDDVNILCPTITSVTKDNDLPDLTFGDLVDGVPPSLVTVADGYVLESGDTLTVTFDVQVDNPMVPYYASLFNTTVATSNLGAGSAAHTDPVISGAIGDRVWLDTDGDGVQDIGEVGIANVEVTLYGVGLDGMPGGGDDIEIGTRLTGANGEYLFDYLAPGTYWVDVTDATVPSGLVQSPGNIDPPIDPIASAPTYTVNTDEVDLTADFGYTSPAGTAIIGDFVWNDIDRDGIQDPAEVGIGGVTLELRSAGPDGVFGTGDDVLEDTTTTAADGSYLFAGGSPTFPGVPAGEYIVVVTDTGGQLTGFAPTVGPQSEGSSISAPVTVAAGDVLDDVDFGYAPAACLPRLDFQTDAAGNPLMAGDAIAGQWAAWGVSVSFTAVDNNGPGTFPDPGPLMIFDSANPTGGDADLGAPNNTCTPPGPGVGTEGEVLQAGENCQPLGNVLIISEDGDATDPDDNAFGGTITFDFTSPVEIEQLEFLDGEAWDVELFDGVTSLFTATTAAAPFDNGFEALAVNIADADSLVFTLPTSGSLGALDFCLGSIRDKVWLDANEDGLFELSEMGISGVTVSLIDDRNGDGVWDPDGADDLFGTADDEPVLATTITDANGDFGFDGLVDGDYLIEITDTGGELSDLGGTTAPGLARELAVSVVDGIDVVGINFGYNATGTLGDRVWSDVDGDGVQDAGEPGIGGVSLTLSLLEEFAVIDGLMDLDGDGAVDSADDGFVDGVRIIDGGLDLDDDGDVDLNDDGVFGGRTVINGGFDLDDSGTVDGSDDGEIGVPVEIFDGRLDLNDNGVADAGDDGFLDGVRVIDGRLDLDGDGDVDGDDNGVFDDKTVIAGEIDFNDSGTVDGSDDGTLYGPIDSTTTASDGSYLFTGLPPGFYTVVVDSTNFDPGQPLEDYMQTGDPDVAAPCSGAGCDDRGAGPLGFLGDSDLTVDFGYMATMAAAVYPISGTVFKDGDEDGFFDDPGDDTFAGVTIELRDDLGNLIATTTTDANGDYLFADQPNGDYTVVVTDEAGILDGYRLTSGLDAIDLTVAGGPVTDIDFGYIRDPETASIGDTVWFDADGDGLQGPTEPGIPNVAMDLYEDDGDGMLEPTVELLDGRIDLDGDGDVDIFDDGEIAGIRVIDGRLDLDGDGTITGADAGTFNGAPVIAGEIDLNGGGVDGSDDGTLVGDDGLPIATTLTDGNGQYLFPGLVAGDYFVDVREGTIPDSTADGVPDLVETGYPGVDPSDAITLSEGERYDDADFGYLPRPGTAAIGDRVWHDTNGDGVQDDGELGIPGVDIIVSGPGPDVTITTGADGFWMATGLTATSTTYSVNYDAGTVPAGLTQTFPGDVSYVVTVNDGDLFTHLDYGFTGGAYGRIGTLTWLDLNGDGDVDAGEPPIEDVTVSLIGDTNGDGVWDPDGVDDLFGTADDEPILETATTDAAGAYLFTGVPLSADYLVDVSDIGGVLADLQKTSGTADTDNNSQDDPYDVAMPGVPTAILTGDFGYTPAGGFGSIGNKVWRDLDGDGFRDAGEPGIEGVTVELWVDVDDNGALTPGVDNLVRTTTTDVSGEYEFKSLPLEDYLVSMTDDGGVLDGFVKTTGVSTVDDNSQANPYPVTLDSIDPDNVTADFGYRANPMNSVLTIAGTVFEDVDNDGVFDDGAEPEIEDATVFLFRDKNGNGMLDPADKLIDSVQTDVNGDYLFTDLPEGDYLLAVNVDGTPVDDFLQTTQTGTGGLQPVTLPDNGDGELPPTDNSVNNNFGFWNGGTVVNPITLAWFKAEDLGSGMRFEWMTATETGNVGFNLYAVGETGMRRLNEELIPSAVIDSLEPQSYELDAWDVVEKSFVLEDVDLLGVRRYHGPFERGETSGTKPETERVPWGEIRAERGARHAAARAAVGRFGSGDSFALSARRGRRAGWPKARLEVSEDGIYRVSYEQLLAAGIDMTNAPAASLALLRGDDPVAIRVEGGGRFGPGSFIEFIGEAMDTLYTRTSVYTLRVAPKKALPVLRQNRPASHFAIAPSSYVERLEVNRDRKYILTAPGEDPWYEEHLLAYGSSTSREFSVDVDGYAGGPAALEVELWGLSTFPRSPDHHVELAWNDSSFGEEWFDGQVVHRVTTELSSGSLVEGTNQLRLTLPGDGGTAWDMVAMDRLWLTYARRFVPRQGRLRFEAKAEAFEVEALSPGEVVVYRVDGDRQVLVGGLSYVDDGSGLLVRFAGQSRTATYHVAEAGALRVPVIKPAPVLQDLPGPAQLLVISHADFLGGIQPLVDARRAEGWTVEVVDVEQIYLRNSDGVVDPETLRNFIRWASRQRGTEAVLLVGGDTYDYHDNLELGSISFVPSLYIATDELVRFVPVDPLYGDVDRDLVPDVAVGRLPVRTPAELTSLVTRILEYGDAPFSATALLAADAYDVPGGYSFTAASDELASMLPAAWTLDRAYLDELSLSDARDQLIGGINAGVGLTSYFGHSGPTAWSFQNLFKGADAAALDNSGRPTVVAQWGCWNNYHVTPKYNTLGHKLLLSGDRGAAAVLGAATLTQAPSEQKLGRLLFARFGRPGATLGGALVDAKQELASTEPDLIDVLLGWTLLGDPTMRMDR